MQSGGVKGLGYLGVESSDIAGWRKFATDILGMHIEDRADGGIDLRIDDRKRRLAIMPADADLVVYIGWDAGDADNFQALKARLAGAGVVVHNAPEAERIERGAAALAIFTEPNTGVRYELFHGAERADTPLSFCKPIAGYKTGAEGLGHVMLAAADRAAAVAFHRDVLGFSESDQIHEPPIHATFMHCNPRHHTLALVEPFGPLQNGSFGHLMLEALALDDVGAAYDAVKREGYKLHLSLGRHSNDHMYSFYVYSPSGFPVEYGYGGRTIGADWQTSQYSSIRLWGLEFLG
jgi:2,3-dihydroxybiphenyl 1,2-dioxygenase